MMNFVKENILVVIFVILAVVVAVVLTDIQKYMGKSGVYKY